MQTYSEFDPFLIHEIYQEFNDGYHMPPPTNRSGATGYLTLYSSLVAGFFLPLHRYIEQEVYAWVKLKREKQESWKDTFHGNGMFQYCKLSFLLVPWVTR